MTLNEFNLTPSKDISKPTSKLLSAEGSSYNIHQTARSEVELDLPAKSRSSIGEKLSVNIPVNRKSMSSLKTPNNIRSKEESKVASKDTSKPVSRDASSISKPPKMKA